MDGDYLFGPYSVTFNAGNMIAPFNISIIDDDVFEIDEHFTLSIGSIEALVIIVDDDGECLLLICITVLLGASYTYGSLLSMVVIQSTLCVK